MDATPAPERSGGRAAGEMRPVTLTPNVMKNAAGSCLAEFGDTRVLCSATVEEGVPAWRKGARAGWVTAEYAMLPASTNRRTPREYRGRKGRSMEIERLIGRSLRAVTRLDRLGEVTITLDCDVLQADGGTRTASVTGAWVALHGALAGLVERGRLPRLPLTGQVAAISAGIVGGVALLDLDYPEDSHADVDLNLVGTSDGGIVEVQGTGERSTLSRVQLNELLDLGQAGIERLVRLQSEATGYRL
ncbi:MAG TPA: ribonuclease PH [Candidatus Olsenella pullistercoris]|uniref:Ribonuclease PH n=1 Tax=Candidatus Olsenella pullistercoris TaxID=2838712 RepID=A0A9D2JDN2_9ACTN|nr:ribonuclease PH [Candidatus Olsenella pullistercoris]